LRKLIAHLKSVGASVLQLPERLEVIDSIPLTHIGKADKKVLKADMHRSLLPDGRGILKNYLTKQGNYGRNGNGKDVSQTAAKSRCDNARCH